MEEETRKHFRGIRILVTLALLAACISFAFTYILFKEVSIPLEQIRTADFNIQMRGIQSKVDYLIASRMNGRLEVEFQMAILNMQEVAQHSTGALQVQAQKAAAETQALLGMLRQAKAPPPAAAPAK